MSILPRNLKRNVRLAPFTTIGLGGMAEYYLAISGNKPVDDLKKALKYAEERSLQIFILGGGSNVIFSDSGYLGLVIHLTFSGITEETSDRDDRVLLRVMAGENWDDFVRYTIDRGLAGLECLSGIPGSAGAVPVQNVGAYGAEASDRIHSVRVLDRMSGDVIDLDSGDCHFSYRNSIFRDEKFGHYIILSVLFSFSKNDKPKIRYAELMQSLRDAGRDGNALDSSKESLRLVREHVIALRRKKSMVYDRRDVDSHSAGSFFINPLLDPSDYEDLKEKIKKDFGEVPPAYESGDKIKIPAAYLIERAGFKKGQTMGSAAISSKHALALVNRMGDSGSTRDLLHLASRIRREVKERFDISLQPEPILVEN